MIARHKRARRTKTSKNANIHQVARRARVSTATVSRVIDDHGGVSQDLTNRVRAAIRALDYHPNRAARNLRRLVAQTVGVIVSDIQNPFFTSVISGIQNVLDEARYTLLLCNSDEDPKRERIHVSTLRAEGVAGIILASTGADTDMYRQLLKAGMPLVAIDRVPAHLQMDLVTVTNAKGACQAVSHLASLGHERIGLITGPCEISTSSERLDGYEQAILSMGLRLAPELIQLSNFRQTGGYTSMQTLLDLPSPPTAVLAANNLMTLGVLQAIHERNLQIPEQIAVVGFDDMAWATSLQPPLTAIAQPTYELGATAAKLLLDRRHKPDQPYRHVVLETQLMVRASCGGKNASVSQASCE